jgi:DNA-directed RNA polymerase specialized sigma24 family protein
MPKGEEKQGFRSVEDALAAIEALSDADWIRLQKAAHYWAEGNWLESADDLLNEAMARVLESTRHWPQDVAFTTFLRNAMRSIAEESRRQRDESLVAVEADLLVDEEDEGPVAGAADDRPSPEAFLIEASDRDRDRKILAEIEALFADDEDALAVVMGLSEGRSAKEIQELFGIDEKRYDTTRRRMRRAIDRQYPRGWRDER